MVVLKVETDIITSTCIAESLIAQYVMLMFVETFKVNIIAFIDDKIMCRTDNFQYLSQSADTDNIVWRDQS